MRKRYILLLILAATLLILTPFKSYDYNGEFDPIGYTCSCFGYEYLSKKIPKYLQSPDIFWYVRINDKKYCFGIPYSCYDHDASDRVKAYYSNIEKFAKFIFSGYPFNTLAITLSLLARIAIVFFPLLLYYCYNRLMVFSGNDKTITLLSLYLFLNIYIVVIYLIFRIAI